MSIRVKALQNIDNLVMGQEANLGPEYARDLIRMGVVVEVDAVEETAGPVINKMAEPPDNQANAGPKHGARRAALRAS